MKKTGNLACRDAFERAAGSQRAFQRQLRRKGSGLLVRWPRSGFVVDDRDRPVIVDVDTVGPPPQAESGTGNLGIRLDIGLAMAMKECVVA